MKKNKILRIGLLLVTALIYFLVEQFPNLIPSQSNNGNLYEAIANQQSDVQVMGRGEVIKVLADDNKGSRHQRFLIKLERNHTLLIAHNIDLAPRVDNLRKGDSIEFYGEFEWNHKGGVVHWTHKDPRNRHPHGWLKHKGNQYW